MLPLVQLGKTELKVSRLGLGTVKFGRNQGVKYPTSFDLPNDQDAQKLLHCARDLGINLLDTAPAYGVSEERLGYLLRNDRKYWVIGTKAGEEFTTNHLGEGTSTFDFSRKALRLSVERSLRRLRTDYLDIVLIHSDGKDVTLIEQHQVLTTLADLKREGWIRAFGMSTKTPEGGLLCAREADLVMTTFDAEQEADHQLMLACKTHNTGVFLKKIFNSGSMFKLGECEGDDNQADPQPNAPIEAQMKVIFAQAAVNSAIIGTINCAHLKNNVQSALLALAETPTTTI